MPTKRILRILLVAEVVFGALFLISSYFSLATLPAPLRAYMEDQSEVGPRDLVVKLALFIPLLTAGLVARVGLFFFWRPARVLFLIQIIAGTLLMPFSRPLVATGLSYACESTGVTITGAILSLVYFSSLKGLFEKPKSAA
jgi:hypothetical protein